MKTKYDWAVVTDNGGGIHLMVWDATGECVWANHNLEYGQDGDLAACVDTICAGMLPDGGNESGTDPSLEDISADVPEGYTVAVSNIDGDWQRRYRLHSSAEQRVARELSIRLTREDEGCNGVWG